MCDSKSRNPHHEAPGLRENEKGIEPQGFLSFKNEENIHLYTTATPLCASFDAHKKLKDSVQMIKGQRFAPLALLYYYSSLQNGLRQMNILSFFARPSCILQKRVYNKYINKYRGACDSRLRGSHLTSTLNLMRIMPP